MMRSMYSGVSGLRVHQTKMDVIGNNIANVNTVGYKSQRVTFGDVFSQTLQSGTSASDETGRGGRNPMQVGLGVNVSSIDILMTPGAAQRTDNPFDLMVDGDGFIVVSDDSGTYFTRAGALRQDEEGNLVIPNGMKVMGWPASKDGTDIERGEVQPIVLTDPSNSTAKPETTTSVELSGNLDKNKSPIDTQIKMYDSLGNLYTTPISLTFDNGQWTLEPKGEKITGKDGEFVILTDTNKNQYAVPIGNVFKEAEAGFYGIKFSFTEKGELDASKDKLVGATVDEKGNVSFDLAKIDLTKAIDPETGKDKPLNATVGSEVGVNINITNLTQYNSKTTVDPKTKDGKAPGAMTGFEVGGDGKIVAHYDNGTTKLLGQIVVANFDNPAGLQKVGDSLFQSTANSGDFDNIGMAANFQAGVLEMSNVDLSQEFTEMITTQRGFQANSRIISVSDEMLQELVNLKR
ncbi:flagellar hook protein FlgE [Niameybacter massiliensis]|uniref:Flagellar hook protein FlgE n=1 Tax=Holtiella tumoricola TaxID=3018743 RepID=A0AA42DNJ6_9FIRM|nr:MULTISPECIES: flagellar hook protein FlgE [Lachnospirales]MDA3732592.1 flagellar hook protein FlgE [Holtiella tumoricola]